MSITTCNGCEQFIDTDEYPQAYDWADGEVCLCAWCQEDPEIVDAVLLSALETLKETDRHSLLTDNSYANHGGMARMSRRMNAIRQARIDLERARDVKEA